VLIRWCFLHFGLRYEKKACIFVFIFVVWIRKLECCWWDPVYLMFCEKRSYFFLYCLWGFDLCLECCSMEIDIGMAAFESLCCFFCILLVHKNKTKVKLRQVKRDLNLANKNINSSRVINIWLSQSLQLVLKNIFFK
jgi:hypothetical protein